MWSPYFNAFWYCLSGLFVVMMFRSIMLSLNRLPRVCNLVHLFGSVWCYFEVIRNELARHAWRVWIAWIKVRKIRSGLACSAGVLLVRANVSSSPSTDHIWFGVRMDGGGRPFPPLPSPYFWPTTAPSVQISFLSPAFRCHENQSWRP